MKKLIALIVLLICVLGLFGCGANKTIGTISGAENEYITINSVTYVKDTNHSFSSKDRDEYLGQVSNSKITMRVYSVDGDDHANYIYALWEWEGDFYVRQEQ